MIKLPFSVTGTQCRSHFAIKRQRRAIEWTNRAQATNQHLIMTMFR